jgi:hypothetical protein
MLYALTTLGKRCRLMVNVRLRPTPYWMLAEVASPGTSAESARGIAPSRSQRPPAAGERTATRRHAGTPARRPDYDLRLAARLAGSLSHPIDDETLRAAIQAVLPEVALGELDSLKLLPGMVEAATDTLRKAWRAGVDLQARASEHPRIASIAILEELSLRRFRLP